jgi:hypothetical protein
LGVGTDTIRLYAGSARQPALAAADHDRSARVDLRIRRRATGGGTKPRQPNRQVAQRAVRERVRTGAGARPTRRGVRHAGAPYLPGPDDPRGGYRLLGPESSRRARALPIWATLAAYGRTGYRALVERHCDLAAHLAAVVDAAPDLERLAEVPLNVVCFRYYPAGRAEPELNDVNRRLSEALLDDGRVFAGGTVYGGRVALRPAISNWRTTAADLDLLVEVVRELGAKTVSAI